jgi:hypothetical protein
VTQHRQRSNAIAAASMPNIAETVHRTSLSVSLPPGVVSATNQPVPVRAASMPNIASRDTRCIVICYQVVKFE